MSTHTDVVLDAGSPNAGNPKSQDDALDAKKIAHVEFPAKAASGLPVLIILLLVLLAAIVALVLSIVGLATGSMAGAQGAIIIIASIAFGFFVAPFLLNGIKIVKPNEARVMTLFGRYIGTLRNDGIYWINPLASATKISVKRDGRVQTSETYDKDGKMTTQITVTSRISLKAMTLTNEKQKINDALGNPIIISIIVIWRVIDTAKAIFDVDDFQEYLSVQSDSALRNIVRVYPYDSTDIETGNEKSLRGSSQEIADKLKAEIQEKVAIAGLEIIEARITHLSYAPEIAAAMLQRQQAAAVVDARQLIVESAVGMVHMALDRLQEHDIVNLDEERKAAMVSNLLVVLCANRDAQPVVNSGTLY
jgi:regulator of protease activity HflC (stomatin/prohibitin superfamily)